MGVIILCFSIAEMVFGMGMNSVTLVADGCHNLADAGGFGIAVFANWAQANARDEKKGERIGLIGGFTNCSVTMILTFCAGFEACCRLFVAPHVYEDPHIGYSLLWPAPRPLLLSSSSPHLLPPATAPIISAPFILNLDIAPVELNSSIRLTCAVCRVCLSRWRYWTY
jgi:hypothetical protein